MMEPPHEDDTRGMVRLEDASVSLREALTEAMTDDQRAFASAMAPDGTCYRAAYRYGFIYIEEHLDSSFYGPTPIPEPPGLEWKAEAPYWVVLAERKARARRRRWWMFWRRDTP
jgi:hypothetical protein